MKINRSFYKKTFAVLCVFALSAAAFELAARETTTKEGASVEDGRPLLISRDLPALEKMWRDLDGAETPRDYAVDLQLRKQGALYKGLSLKVEARLLRAAFVPTPKENDPNDGFYDLWAILPDSKRDPIRILSKTVPPGFQADEKVELDRPNDPNLKLREEIVVANAIYYRTTAFDSGDDIRVAPTLVARTFQTIDAAKASLTAKEKSERRERSRRIKEFVVIGAFIFLFLYRRLRAPKALAAILAASLTISSAPASEPVSDDVFWSTLSNATEQEWERETRELRPALDEQTPDAARRQEIARKLLQNAKRHLTPSVLRERASDAYRATTAARFALADASERTDFFAREEPRQIGFFAGEAKGTERIADDLYRMDVEEANGARVTVYSATEPNFDAAPNFFDGESASRRVAGSGIYFGREKMDGEERAAILATRTLWTPTDSPLGRIGADVAALNAMEIYPPDALEKARTPQERQKIARSMRWTTSDALPFYETLAAFKRARPKDERPEITDAPPLFNDAPGCRGRPIALKGWVRRANLLLSDDENAIAATGVDRYYQLYLFANDSQGWPIVLCAPTLPKEMKPGGGKKYRVSISFRGYLYKTWAYKTSEKSADKSHWARVPVLIGNVERVYKEEEDDKAPPIPTTTIFATFAILAAIWALLRRRANRGGDGDRGAPGSSYRSGGDRAAPGSSYRSGGDRAAPGSSYRSESR